MDFQLAEEQLALIETARRFARQEIAPKAQDFDRSGEFPRDLIRRAWEIGLMNEMIPQAYGGLGLGLLESCLITEELSWGCAGMTTSIMVTNLGLMPVMVAGTEEQKRRWLTPFTMEFRIAAFCLTEPGSGSDVAGMQLQVSKHNGSYILNGTKRFITNGGVADVHTVFGTLDRTRQHRGICAFVVDAHSKGVRPGKKEDKMGQRASNTAEVVFEDCEVPADQMLGREGEGFKVAMQTLDRSRPSIAALAVGLGQRALDEAVAYSKERKQFNTPISEFEGIQFMLADMGKDLHAARLLTWHAAQLIDRGQEAGLYSSYAKCFATDAAMRATTDAVQIFGGYGYMKDYPVEKLMRDAKLMQIYEGTNQIQRVVIARRLLGR
ncbi:MAG: acyl-CoA dehydrogenase family protein [Nitrospirae bacterium]|nr:acyl-CoA dehydrogenase family protein [Nitrospirota bacterium]